MVTFLYATVASYVLNNDSVNKFDILHAYKKGSYLIRQAKLPF